MPCSDSRVWDDYCVQQEMDKLTKLLCEACRTIENDEQMSSEVKAWWIEHKKQDTHND